MPHTVTATAVRREFADILERVERGERVLITRHGKAIAAIIGQADLAELEKVVPSKIVELAPVDANGSPVTE